MNVFIICSWSNSSFNSGPTYYSRRIHSCLQGFTRTNNTWTIACWGSYLARSRVIIYLSLIGIDSFAYLQVHVLPQTFEQGQIFIHFFFACLGLTLRFSSTLYKQIVLGLLVFHLLSSEEEGLVANHSITRSVQNCASSWSIATRTALRFTHIQGQK